MSTESFESTLSAIVRVSFILRFIIHTYITGVTNIKESVEGESDTYYRPLERLMFVRCPYPILERTGTEEV